MKKGNKIRIKHINAQSLLESFDCIKSLVNDENIDILCVSETWLSPNLEDRYVHIPNFKVFRNDLGKGGGSCIYVNDCLTVKEIKIKTENNVEIEDVWVSVQMRKLPSFIIGSIYRHPKATVDSFEYLSNVFKEISLYNKPYFILGDINDNLFYPNCNLNKIINNLGLSQLVTEPTRITKDSNTLIDVFITNKPEIVTSIDISPCPVADHEQITAAINIEKPKRELTYKTFRSLKNYNSNNLCNNILTDYSDILSCILQTDDINKQVDIFTKALNGSVEKCAPKITAQVTRPPAPWINEEIKDMLRERDKLQKLLKSNRNNEAISNNFKQKRKQVKYVMAKSKAQYFKNKFQECGKNSAKKWNAIKGLLPDKKKNIQSNNFDDLESKAEEFNEYFSKVGQKAFEKTQENINTRVDVMQRTSDLRSDNVNLFKPQPVTIETVILTFKQIRDTNAVGTDDITFRFLRDSLPIMAFYLTIIINTSIVTSSFPSLYKHSLISPIFKSGDPDDVNNYRPIAILSVVSKVIEKIISNQLKEFLEENKLLSETQHGFRAKLSTETALVKVTDKIYNNMDKGYVTLLVLCDLSKAFDSVDHNTLLDKLRHHNIDTSWFREYLSDRTQSVKLGNVISSKKEVSFGVPQGSILGPLLFTIFVNDMQKVAGNCMLVQYADDSQFIFTGTVENIRELIINAERTLVNVKIYFDSNGLLINAKKTQIIIFGSRQNLAKLADEININFDGNNLKLSKHVKNLGLYMDPLMTFNTHTDEIYKKAISTLMFINRIKNNIDKDTRILIVQSLTLSIINYCSVIWGSACKTQLCKLQKLQNFAAKVALGKGRKYDHATPYINELKWMKIKDKCNFDASVYMYKIVNELLPNWLTSISRVGQTNPFSTRQAADLKINRTRTTAGDRELTVRGSVLWNKLPSEIKKSSNLMSFRCNLKTHILKH